MALPEETDPEDVSAMRSFLETVYTHPRCITTLFPVRDGVSLTLIR
jgi:predicted O-methyltransferase YrrM